MRKKKTKGFTLIEMLVVISIIALLIGILLPALGMARRQATRLKNNTRIRSIYQAMVGFASGNRDWYPGLNSRGQELTLRDEDIEDSRKLPKLTNESGGGDTAEGRHAVMLKGKMISADTAVSPLDNAASRYPWQPGPEWTNKINYHHFSYAMLAISERIPVDQYGRNYCLSEWGAGAGGKMNNRAVILCDRNTGQGADIDRDSTTRATSLHDNELWQGSSVWNDGHTEFLDRHWEVSTKYAGAPSQHNADRDVGTDNLFEQGSPQGNRKRNNAIMVHHGWEVANSVDKAEDDNVDPKQPD